MPVHFVNISDVILQTHNQIYSEDVNASVINFNDVRPATYDDVFHVFINGDHGRLDPESKASDVKRCIKVGSPRDSPCII